MKISPTCPSRGSIILKRARRHTFTCSLPAADWRALPVCLCAYKERATTTTNSLILTFLRCISGVCACVCVCVRCWSVCASPGLLLPISIYIYIYMFQIYILYMSRNPTIFHLIFSLFFKAIGYLISYHKKWKFFKKVQYCS